MSEKKFNINWLESFRQKLKRTIPQPLRGIIIFSIMIGVPGLLLYAIFTSTFTWWSIILFLIYFGVIGLSIADSVIGKRRVASSKEER